MSSAPSPLSPPPPKMQASSLGERTRTLWSRAREEALYARRHVLGLEDRPPPTTSPLRRFVYGAALPFHVMRRVLRAPDIRRAYLRVMLWQLVAMIPVGIVVFIVSSDEDQKRHGVAHGIALVSAAFTTLSIAEWIIVAFGREYHDHLSYAAAALSGVPHTPPSRPPRTHLDFAWLWLKARRKLRSLVLVGLGIPLCYLLRVIPAAGHTLYAAALGLWTFYWLAVFALGNSELAWHQPAAPREPFFLRASVRASRVPVLGTPFLLYTQIARPMTRSVHHPCQAFEDAPWEAAGLAAVRVIFGIPGLYLLTRPLMPIAASEALLSRRALPPARASAVSPAPAAPPRSP